MRAARQNRHRRLDTWFHRFLHLEVVLILLRAPDIREARSRKSPVAQRGRPMRQADREAALGGESGSDRARAPPAVVALRPKAARSASPAPKPSAKSVVEELRAPAEPARKQQEPQQHSRQEHSSAEKQSTETKTQERLACVRGRASAAISDHERK